jgi:hypothetical protein
LVSITVGSATGQSVDEKGFRSNFALLLQRTKPDHVILSWSKPPSPAVKALIASCAREQNDSSKSVTCLFASFPLPAGLTSQLFGRGIPVHQAFDANRNLSYVSTVPVISALSVARRPPISAKANSSLRSLDWSKSVLSVLLGSSSRDKIVLDGHDLSDSALHVSFDLATYAAQPMALGAEAEDDALPEPIPDAPANIVDPTMSVIFNKLADGVFDQQHFTDIEWGDLQIPTGLYIKKVKRASAPHG